MPDLYPAPEKIAGRTAWILSAPGSGDNHQLASLGRLTAQHIQWFDEFDPVSRVILDRIKPTAYQKIPKAKQARYRPPWPDLIMIAGGRSVIDAMRIRHASQGHSRVICIGRPWAPLNWFDLVITTPQYRLPESEPVICLSLPLNLRLRDQLQSERLPEEWHSLPRPWTGVLLGGDSGSYHFSRQASKKIGSVLKKQQTNGSVIVVGSPRTPDHVLQTLADDLQMPRSIHPWGPNNRSDPYAGILKYADHIRVSGDSASMLADAVHTGKPVSVLPLTPRWHSRWLRAFEQLDLPGRGIKNRAVQKGWWVPARDLDQLHARALHQGLIQSEIHSEAGSSGCGKNLDTLYTEIKTVLDIIHRWFD